MIQTRKIASARINTKSNFEQQLKSQRRKKMFFFKAFRNLPTYY